MRKAIASVLIAAALALGASAQTSWTPEIQVKTKLVGSVQVSPDGRRVAYTVSEAVMTADRSEFVTQIWLANSDGSNNFQVTFGDKSSTNPRWSPDGEWIAFTSNRKDNRNNLYLIRAGGGEAEMLTDLKGGIAAFDWSHDGKWIAFTMTDPKTDDEEKNDRGRNDFRWVDENLKMVRLHVVPVGRDAAGKREPRRLTEGNFNVGGFDWSPDDRSIAFSHTKSAGANDWPTADISTVDVASGKVAPLVATRRAETAPRYSPDGRWVAYSTSDDPPRWAQSNRIAVIAPSGGQARILSASHDEQPAMVDWTVDSKSIFFTESRGVTTALYSVDVVADKITRAAVPDGVFTVTMNARRDTFGMTWQNAVTPGEAYVSRVDRIEPVRISRANDDVAKLPMPKTETIRWKSKDGREIEGLLTYPIGYKPGTRVPLILNIHGGPAGVFQQSFVGGRGVYPLAVFASRGFAVLRPNPRGSSGYGTEFRRANIRDWGGMDYQDLMTGVDEAIRLGVADAERLGVMGWSYGGFMTSWIVTQTKRFKAASAGAPVTNLMSFNGTADIPAFVPDYFGAEFWDDPEIYRKHSAMFNVKAVSTPTLIQHGEADIRVPIGQGYEFYNALRRQGVPVRMIVMPRQPHGPNEPKMHVAAMQSNLEWFERYLR